MELIQWEYQKLLNIYSKSIPDFVIPFLRSPALQRMSWIWQNCGLEFSKLFNLYYPISRLEHSLWVSMIIWNFTWDKKQTLAWLFHDISHSVFSHVGDFILWDAEKQESSEIYITEILLQDKVIMEELQKLWIQLWEVDNYELYSVADNKGPQLAADRLEYNLSTLVTLKSESTDSIKRIYEDIIVLVNEEGIDELWFQSPDIAEFFGILTLKNDIEQYSSPEAVVSMDFFAEILKNMIEKWYMSYKELYTLEDIDVINLLEEAEDVEIQKKWKYYKNLSQCRIWEYIDEWGIFQVSTKCKRRYVDPLVRDWNKNIRVSEFSEKFILKRNAHLNQKDRWVSIDFKM